MSMKKRLESKMTKAYEVQKMTFDETAAKRRARDLNRHSREG